MCVYMYMYIYVHYEVYAIFSHSLPRIIIICFRLYDIIISWYECDIQVIAQDRGEANVAGDDLDIMRVSGDITNFYSMEIVYQ